MSDIGLIILAAGASTRMGTPKQLLPYQGRTLIEHIVEQAIASVCNPIIVVLGANAELIKPKLASFLALKGTGNTSTSSVHRREQGIEKCPNRLGDCYMFENPAFAEGMSSSIRAGIELLSTKNPQVKAAVLMVCDQPFVSTQLINRLVENYRTTNSLIVASEYAGILGVPALCDRTFFPHLMALNGDVGAKQLIKRFPQNTIGVPAPEVAFDLDTPADYQRLEKGL